MPKNTDQRREQLKDFLEDPFLPKIDYRNNIISQLINYIELKDTEKVKQILETEVSNFNGLYSWTLNVSVIFGHSEILQYLVNNNTSICFPKILLSSLENQEEECFKILLKQKIITKEEVIDYTNGTIMLGTLEMFKSITEEYAIKIKNVHLAQAVIYKNIPIIEYLIKEHNLSFETLIDSAAIPEVSKTVLLKLKLEKEFEGTNKTNTTKNKI